jgi:glycogen(starch) synthase
MGHDSTLLLESSWEVCNKVGGIYTVVSSKAAKVNAAYKKNYITIGPYFHHNVIGQFQEEIPPSEIKKAFDALKEKGIMCHYGTWQIEGEPKAILLDTTNFWHNLNDVKRQLWDWYKVDSLLAAHDYDEPVLWSFASGMLIQELTHHMPHKQMVAQFHEWLSGAGLLYARKHCHKIGTVFTTHATVLGRSLANADAPLYELLGKTLLEEEAKKHGVQAKHSMEKAAANACHVFTTVSEITGMEAEHLLGRKPDVLLPNGLDLGKFPVFEEILIKHRVQRDQIREFCLAYFFPYYHFDIENTIFYFLASRYEFRAKGIDHFIKALGMLNKRLKEEKSTRTIVAFLWVPTGIRNIRQELIENKTYFRDIKDSLDESKADIEKNLLYSLLEEKSVSPERVLGEQFLHDMKKKLARFRKQGTPPLVTHDIYDSNDAIVRAIYEAGLLNKEEDRVKVIYYPMYLTGADGLLDLNYYEAMQGCHLGVFPSYYEPWGYTPLEAGALGVPAITTDMSGFGRYFCADCVQTDFPGIYVVRRLGKPEQDAINQLADFMHHFALLSREERTKDKLEARRVASTVDWEVLVQYYLEAHELAVKKAA